MKLEIKHIDLITNEISIGNGQQGITMGIRAVIFNGFYTLLGTFKNTD